MTSPTELCAKRRVLRDRGNAAGVTLNGSPAFIGGALLGPGYVATFDRVQLVNLDWRDIERVLINGGSFRT